MSIRLNEDQFRWFKYWLPAVLSGAMAGFLFLILGQTPFVRAAGLAMVIVGVTLALRRMGSYIAVIGAITLALSSSFWSQTGGAEGNPATIVIAIAAAMLVVLLGSLISRRPDLAFGLGILIFAFFFWSQIGTPRSLRLTGFVVSWLMFLLTDMLLLTNPHPNDVSAPPILRPKRAEGEAEAPRQAQSYHLYGILLLFGTGVLNDPLLVLFAPAILVGLFLTQTSLSTWYLGVLMLIIGVGLRGLGVDYLDMQSRWIQLESWRFAQRWIDLMQLVINQYTVIGMVLSVLGLARLSRWYPPLGIVTMIAYGAYVFFGLVYSGPTRGILLLPLYIIQIIWMSYAVFTLGQWLRNSFGGLGPWLHHLVLALYTLLPISMLIRILQS